MAPWKPTWLVPRAARSNGGDLASRQEGAAAEKAVPFSKLRLSIAIQHQESAMTMWICLLAIAAMISSCLCVAAVAMNAGG